MCPDRTGVPEGQLKDGREALVISFAAASKHVKVLERAGLLERRVAGRTHVCRLVPEPIEEAYRWLARYQRYGPEGPGAEGSIMHARMRIGDQVFMAFDSPPVHAFDFTASLSLFVSCESEEEIDRLFAGLSEGGFVMMPLSTEYGFSAKYAWLSDRFGVSWQLSWRLGFDRER